MSYKTILVHCDAASALPQRLGVAVKLAQRYRAHLVGLHVQAPIIVPAFSGGAVPLDSLYVAYETAAKVELDQAAAAFAGAVKDADISSEWRIATAYHEEELVLQARYADLLILGQTDAAVDSTTPAALPEAVAIASARPTLAIPHAGIHAMPGNSVMLCWNASRESARAATEALPFLVAADKVVVLIVDDKPRRRGIGAEAAADVAAWLGRHDVKVTVERDAAPDGDVGNVILSRAADHGIDLIVMGLYGHSRLREVILGGASRTLLSSMTVPVLMAH